MTGALVILVAMLVIGLLLFITDKTYFRHHHSQGEPEKQKLEVSGTEPSEEIETIPNSEFCCGQHIVCEKTSLSIVSDEIIYYDDEELDRFAGRTPESYSAEETEEFRDVLMTLLPEDIAGWAKSVTLRKIELPLEVKDELLLLISDLRNARPIISPI